VASKAAGFAVLLRFLKVTFFDTQIGNQELWSFVTEIDWPYIIAILSVLTMTLGNLVAVWQTNVKRLLAYSSIAHAGYLLMGVVVLNNIGVAAVLIYFFFYMIMNLGAFFVVMLIANNINSEELDDYKGLGYRAPILGIAMTLFLISLTGLPPTAGFIGKLYIFSAVIDSGYLWLAVIGVLNSVVSLYYYVKVFKYMYLHDVDSKKPALNYSPASIIILLLLAIPTLFFGLYFTPIIEWANKSAMIFLGN
jgi:NADH-quinone oxidoreductase subunit N